jgi:glycerol dehydrogenase-like iron-containing ADH family enzyme
MVETLPYIFGAPGTYLQGPGVLEAVGPHLARVGTRALGVVDPLVRSQVEPALQAACTAEGVAWQAEPFPGECTEAAVEHLAAAAHSLYAGLSALPTPTPYLHGEKVAFGVVVQTFLEGWPDAERQELLDFYRAVGLPATLTQIGLGEATAADLRRAAEIACRPGTHMQHVRPAVTVECLLGVLESLRG